MPQTISPWDILTTQEKHLEREQSPECTTEVRIHAADLAERVSRLCDRLGIRPSITSGFRTASANSSAGGKVASAHMTGEAVDIADPKGEIGAAVLSDPGLLSEFDLYVEDPRFTKGWVHLQIRATKSGRRIFIP